jgi:hypothetical protein
MLPTEQARADHPRALVRPASYREHGMSLGDGSLAKWGGTRFVGNPRIMDTARRAPADRWL